MASSTQRLRRSAGSRPDDFSRCHGIENEPGREADEPGYVSTNEHGDDARNNDRYKSRDVEAVAVPVAACRLAGVQRGDIEAPSSNQVIIGQHDPDDGCKKRRVVQDETKEGS